MNIKVERLEGSVVNIVGVLETEEWKKYQEKALKKLAKDVEIKGFRKGQAPINLVKTNLGAAKIFDEATNEVLNEVYVKALDEHKLEPIDNPDVKVTKLSEDEFEFSISLIVFPEVTLGQYKGLSIPKEPVLVTDQDVEEEIKKLQKDFAQVEVKEDQSVEKGDIAVIDFEGFIDGVAFEGGKAENFDLEIGSNTFIPGFEDQIIGMKKDEEKDINVTFPEDYHPDFAGKDATFKVKVKEVKVKVLPELNDDFALDVNKGDVTTYDELVESIREEIREERKKQSESKVFNELLKTINESSSVDVPAKFVEENTKHEFEDFKNRISRQGLTLEKYLEMTKLTEEQILSDIKDSLRDRIKLTYVLGKIGEENNIKVEQEDVENEFNKIASMYGMEVEQVKQALSERVNEMVNEIYMRKVEDFIRANNEIS